VVHDPIQHTQSPQEGQIGGKQRLADVESGEWLPFHEGYGEAPPSQERRGRGPGGTAPDHQHVDLRLPGRPTPPRGDARKAETDDEAAQLYVTFPRFPTAVRSRIIGYIWDSNAPAGSTFPSAKVGTITFVVVRSGKADLGKWITETRNVCQDYKRIYGEEPGEAVGAVSISSNSQNTGARAEAFFGEILFRKP
jgi:hypothetical protein